MNLLGMLSIVQAYLIKLIVAYFDAKTIKEKPKWYRVDVKYERHMQRYISLRELRADKDPALANMQLLRRPQLSVQRVSPQEWDHILKLESQVSDMRPGEDEAQMVSCESEKLKSQEIQAEIAYTHGG